MEGFFISDDVINKYREYLRRDEKSKNTIEKYIRDVVAFCLFCNGNEITKELVIEYKNKIINDGYAARSINSMLASLNSIFSFLGWHDLRVKSVKIQQQMFCSEELTREEYVRLCNAAEKQNNLRLSLILQTICSTGIRISELEYITVESVLKGQAVIRLKGKTRVIFIVKELQKKLLQYVSSRKINAGPIFVTSTGRKMNRSNIWREMKRICKDAGVNHEKVFPHNLRHLFAVVFYSIQKDIAKLADVLGHSNISTTRLYIVSSGNEHRKCMDRMHLLI